MNLHIKRQSKGRAGITFGEGGASLTYGNAARGNEAPPTPHGIKDHRIWTRPFLCTTRGMTTQGPETCRIIDLWTHRMHQTEDQDFPMHQRSLKRAEFVL